MDSSPIVPFRHGKLWGVCSPSRELLVPCLFDFACMPFRDIDGDWLLEVRGTDQTFGWVRWHQGQISVVAPRFAETLLIEATPLSSNVSPKTDFRAWHRFDARLIPVRETNDSLWAYVDRDGNPRIPAIFKEANTFCGDTAAVCVAGKWGTGQWGLIGRDGQWRLEPRYGLLSQTFEGLRVFRRHLETAGVRYGYLDGESLEEVIAPRFTSARGFSGGLACVGLGKGQGKDIAVIDRSGNAIASELSDAGPGFNGFAAVQRNGKWIIIGADGTARHSAKFSAAGRPSEGLIALKKGKWGFFDLRQPEVREILPPRFKAVSLSGFQDGSCCVMDGEKRIFHVDISGERLSEPDFSDLMEDFAAGRCLVSRYADGLHGYIEPGGELCIPRIYQLANRFEDCGLASVVSAIAPSGERSGYGFIDRNGQEFWDD